LDREKPNNNILAFAPIYSTNNSNNKSHLQPLPFAKQEAVNIVEKQGGTIYYDKEKDNASHYMFTHELYNMNLNASMVALSACNTGNGD
jgi:CHAT domain-containing protein